jgi:[protein-PII] uridylyltransferase
MPSTCADSEPLDPRGQLAAARDRMGQALELGAPGSVVCRALSDVCDQLVSERVAEAVESAGDLAVVATGGWGRRELAPYSDLDIVILTPKATEESAQRAAEAVLYPLWDAGLRIGHAVQDPAGAAELAAGDLPTATALLDARRIVGAAHLLADLEAATWRATAPGGDSGDLVAKLAGEMNRRHRRFGESIYLLEPNVKHGIGGFRDLATALWVARARFGSADPDELVGRGQLTRRQASALVSSRDFLLALRCRLQLHAGRATDQLTFEAQEAIGPGLYPDARPMAHKPAVAPAVEALMRDYYRHARGVAQIASQLIDSASSPRRRPTVARVDSNLILFAGKLSVADPEILDRRPDEMLRLFRVAADLDVPVYWHTRELVAERTSGRFADLRRYPGTAAHFLAALTDERDAAQPSLLEEMHQVGLLAAMIPEFAACTHRIQHDLYHVYTVDQHQLYAVGMLKRISRGELSRELPLATEVYGQLERRTSLYLATLLHDVGKPLGKGHSETGARIAAETGARLGLEAGDAELAGFLVREHLTMSHLSQRRDLSDPEVIRKFAERIGDLETLRQLYLLTVCDAAMTSPGNLSVWKAELLAELYGRTRDYLAATGVGQELGPATRTARARRRCRELLETAALEGGPPPPLDLLETLDDHVVTAVTGRQLFRLMQVAGDPERERPVALRVRSYRLRGHSEVAVVAADAPGLLADLTGTFAAFGVSVEGAVIGVLEVPEGPLAVDLFFVRDAAGGAIDSADPRWERIRAELDRVVGDERPERVPELLARRQKSGLPPRVTPEVATHIGFATGASDKFSVLEVFTRDRVGLLSEISRVLADHGLDIYLAKVSTEGEKAADVFYVREPGGGMLSDERQREVTRALLAALADSPEPREA